MIIRYVADENKGQALNKPLTSPFGAAYNESNDSAPNGSFLLCIKGFARTAKRGLFS